VGGSIEVKRRAGKGAQAPCPRDLEAAQARNEKGTAQLAFSLDRQGRVTATRILKSSGSAALDQETLELVRRAQPFPALPAAMAGAQIDLTVPVRFNMH